MLKNTDIKQLKANQGLSDVGMFPSKSQNPGSRVVDALKVGMFWRVFVFECLNTDSQARAHKTVFRFFVERNVCISD